ncbi:hypothetical protein [Nocardia sp. CA-290969]|uniref:hypothetical protein n=1 Tax=Nocardia sp. CA-290969 TaxID=3239986 RepID=UPI003D8E8C28
MRSVLPLPIPRSLVELHRFDLSAPYTPASNFITWDVVSSPSGDTYALSRLRRYVQNAGSESDPPTSSFGYVILTRYSPEGTVAAIAVSASEHPRGALPTAANGLLQTLCILPGGTLTTNANPDRTALISPHLTDVLATYTEPARRPFEEVVPGDPFACSIDVTPSGRLLCVTAEYGTNRYGASQANIVGLADGSLTPDNKPTIRAIASLDPEPAHQSTDDLRPHVQFEGAPVGLANRPRPALTELLTSPSGHRYLDWGEAGLGRPAVLADDLFVVPVFERLTRRATRGRSFEFLLLDDHGAVRGKLAGLDQWRHSPYPGQHFTVVADPHRGHIFHLNNFGLFAWTRDGVLRCALDTTTKTFKPLTNFALKSFSPAGELVFVHNKQHLVLRMPTPEDLHDLPGAVENALRTYTRDRTALKKQWGPVNWHWPAPDVRVYHL